MSQPRHPQQASLGHNFSVAVLHADLHLPGSHSLKEKRGRLARVLNHLRKKHPIVICEVGDQDVWGRAGLAAVTLSSDHDLARRILEAVVETLVHEADSELLWHEIEWL